MKKYIAIVLCAMILSSCALLERGIVIPTATESVRG